MPESLNLVGQLEPGVNVIKLFSSSVKLRQYKLEYSLVSILAQYIFSKSCWIPPEWKPLAQFTSTPNDKKKSFITLTLVFNVIKLFFSVASAPGK